MPYGRVVLPGHMGDSLWKKAATAIVYQELLGGVLNTIAISGYNSEVIASQAAALNTDNIIFNAATVYVAALGGGSIYIEGAGYNLVATWNVAVDIFVRGASWAVVLNYNAAGNCITFTGDNAQIRDLAVISVNVAAGAPVFNDGFDGCEVHNLSLTSNDASYSIAFEGGTDAFKIMDNTILAGSGIHVEDASITGWIENNRIVDITGGIAAAIYAEDVTDLIITDNIIETITDAIPLAIRVDDCSNVLIEGNIVNDSGILVRQCLRGKVLDNTIIDSTTNPIGVTNSPQTQICDNTIHATAGGTDGINISFSPNSKISDNLVVSEALCVFAIRLGTSVATHMDFVKVSGNIVITVGAGDWDRGIVIMNSCGDYIQITDNFLSGNFSSAGISTNNSLVAPFNLNAQISGNYVYNAAWGLYLDIDNAQVFGNYFIDNNVGIEITVNADSADLTGQNTLIDNTTQIIENGTNTRLPVHSLAFVDGTVMLNLAGGPWGWEIDEDLEYAIAIGVLPLGVQQVVRWKIWATSIVLEADAMRLEIQGYGGASNEPFTTETVAVADHPSTTTNFAALDVVYWVLDATDDADIGDMLGGDQIMIKVLHEIAGGPDCETDAAFTGIEIEYV